MANAYVEACEKAEQFLIDRRRQLIAGIPRLIDSDLDRVVRHAENLTALQAAIDSIGRAVILEEQADRRRVERRSGERRSGAGAPPPREERRGGERRQSDRRRKPAAGR
jgi:hypothetical protein